MGESAAESTGLFTIGKSYGIQNATDGSSNTVAYSEALVGDANDEAGILYFDTDTDFLAELFAIAPMISVDDTLTHGHGDAKALVVVESGGFGGADT